MSTNLEIFYNVAGIILWLTAFPALWVSGRIIRRNSITGDRSTHMFLWLVLGGFFRIPLVELLSILTNLIAQAIPPDLSVGDPSFRIGITGGIVKLSIYALGIYFAQRSIANQNVPFLNKLSLSAWEQRWMVLGMAGLLYQLVGDLVGNFILLTFAGTSS
jgi:hypothetical protein